MQKLKSKQAQEQKQELVQLIDDSYLLDTELKEKKKILDGNKDKLKQTALIEGKPKLSGELIDVAFSNTTTSEIDPKDLYNLMVEMGQEDAFFDLVSVKLGDAKKRLGDMVLEGITKSTVKKFNKMIFKKRG